VLKNDSPPSTEITMNQAEEGLGDLELKWGSDDQVKMTLETKELMDRLTLKGVVESAEKGEVTATYSGKNDKWATKLKLDYNNSETKIDGQFSFAYENVTFGAQGVVDPSDMTPSDMSLGVRLDQDSDSTYTLSAKDKFNQYAVSMYYKVNKQAELGAEAKFDVAKGGLDLTVGGSYKCDDNCKLRYQLNQTGVLRMAYEHRFNSNVGGCIGFGMNISDRKMTEKIGYKLTFDC